jgi:hypothetical protein
MITMKELKKKLIRLKNKEESLLLYMAELDSEREKIQRFIRMTNARNDIIDIELGLVEKRLVALQSKQNRH